MRFGQRRLGGAPGSAFTDLEVAAAD